MGVNSLPKTVTRQRRVYNLNPGPTAPESSTLTTQLPSRPKKIMNFKNFKAHEMRILDLWRRHCDIADAWQLSRCLEQTDRAKLLNSRESFRNTAERELYESP